MHHTMSHKKDTNKIMLIAIAAAALVAIFFALQQLANQPPSGGGKITNLPITTVGTLDPSRTE